MSMNDVGHDPGRVEIVLNDEHVPFELCAEAEHLFQELSGESFDPTTTPRHHPCLVHVVRKYINAHEDPIGRLRIVHVPEGSVYRIVVYDHYETLVTPQTEGWVQSPSSKEMAEMRDRFEEALSRHRSASRSKPGAP